MPYQKQFSRHLGFENPRDTDSKWPDHEEPNRWESDYQEYGMYR